MSEQTTQDLLRASLDPSDRQSFAFWPDPKSGPWVVVFDNVMIDGREESIGVHIWHAQRSEPLTTSVLRSIPFGRLSQEWRSRQIEVYSKILEEHGEEVGAPLRNTLRILAAPKKRRGRFDPAHFKRVAEVYNEAWRQGIHPTKHVAEVFGENRNVAAKWVARARKLGFLPLTVRRKAKGNPQ